MRAQKEQSRQGISAPSPYQTPPRTRLEDLRQTIKALETDQVRGAQIVMATGFPVLDKQMRQQGLCFSALHEMVGAGAFSFMLHLLGQYVREKTHGPFTLLFCVRAQRRDYLYGAGLAEVGLDPDRCLVASCLDDAQMLWAMEEGLRSGAVQSVIAEPSKSISIAAGRRLHLAAKEGGAIGFSIPYQDFSARYYSHNTSLPPSAAVTRWCIDPLRGSSDKSSRPIKAAWRVSLSPSKGVLGAGGVWCLGTDLGGKPIMLEEREQCFP